MGETERERAEVPEVEEGKQAEAWYVRAAWREKEGMNEQAGRNYAGKASYFLHDCYRGPFREREREREIEREREREREREILSVE